MVKKKKIQFEIRQVLVTLRSQDNSVSVVTGLWAGRPSAQTVAAARDFSLLQNVHTGCWTLPHSYSMGTRPLFQGVKWPGPESDHLPPTSVEVTHEWKYTYTPHTHVQGMYRGKFAFTFTYNCVGSENTVIAFGHSKIQFLG